MAEAVVPWNMESCGRVEGVGLGWGGGGVGPDGWEMTVCGSCAVLVGSATGGVAGDGGVSVGRRQLRVWFRPRMAG